MLTCKESSPVAGRLVVICGTVASSASNWFGSIALEMSELEATSGVVRSIRTDGDSWDITESVGATALGVAASRASETAQPDAQVHIVDSADEMARLGRPVPADMAEEAANSELLRARLGP